MLYQYTTSTSEYLHSNLHFPSTAETQRLRVANAIVKKKKKKMLIHLQVDNVQRRQRSLHCEVCEK